MAYAGVVAVAEPAFWAGFDRKYPETFIDYFRQISEFEPTRAAQYGIRHYCWVAVNPKEAENPSLSREVLRHMPEFFQKPTVLGVGETGLGSRAPAWRAPPPRRPPAWRAAPCVPCPRVSRPRVSHPGALRSRCRAPATPVEG